MKSGLTMENADLMLQETGDSQSPTHSRSAECHSRQAIQTRADHSDRMDPPSRGLPGKMLLVAPSSSGPVCHQVQQQTDSICITSPRPLAWAVDAFSLPWEDLDP